mmetsp:Transcript_84626/g.213409  ORF Transcript_84626/g.213409 Transcript_84626/m.213409 type:complete len:217 (-) Transcript_84626:24-674(-)
MSDQRKHGRRARAWTQKLGTQSNLEVRRPGSSCARFFPTMGCWHRSGAFVVHSGRATMYSPKCTPHRGWQGYGPQRLTTHTACHWAPLQESGRRSCCIGFADPCAWWPARVSKWANTGECEPSTSICFHASSTAVTHARTSPVPYFENCLSTARAPHAARQGQNCETMALRSPTLQAPRPDASKHNSCAHPPSLNNLRVTMLSATAKVIGSEALGS